MLNEQIRAKVSIYFLFSANVITFSFTLQIELMENHILTRSLNLEVTKNNAKVQSTCSPICD